MKVVSLFEDAIGLSGGIFCGDENADEMLIPGQ